MPTSSWTAWHRSGAASPLWPIADPTCMADTAANDGAASGNTPGDRGAAKYDNVKSAATSVAALPLPRAGSPDELDAQSFAVVDRPGADWAARDVADEPSRHAARAAVAADDVDKGRVVRGRG